MSSREGRKSLVLITSLAFLFSSLTLYAGPVDPAQVRQATQTFLKSRLTRIAARADAPGIRVQASGVETKLSPGGLREIRGDDGAILAYVADLEPRGFVVLSADTDIAPVIAYSLRSPFPAVGDREHPLYRMVREDLRLRTRALAEHPELRTEAAGRSWARYAAGQADVPVAFQQWPPEGSTSTGGWLETTWDQSAPYNQFCPLDPVDGVRSYTGCGATAVGQLMHYHQRADPVFGPNDAYATWGGLRIDADSQMYDFPSFADLNRYLDVVRAKYGAGTTLDDADLAALNFACGVVMQMDYSSEGSGATPSAMRNAMIARYGFASSDMFGGLSAESLLLLQENVINRLPALVTIGPADGFGGHVVVCDGYNTEGEYHLNYGWGARSPGQIADVWYRLPTGFYARANVITETILNIRPVEPALRVEPAFLDFHSLPGQESDVQILRIRSTVDGVQVHSISSPEGFLIAMPDEFSGQVAGFTIPRARQAAALLVRFRPERAGGYYGTLAIRYNDGLVRYVILRGWSWEGGTQVAAGAVSGTWSLDQSPYFVVGDIQVPEGGELVIEPGVKVFFLGPYGLTIGWDARLTARGNAVQPIELTAWNKDTGWAGLRFIASGADDVLSHCSISYTKKGAALMPERNSTPDEPDTGNAPQDLRGGAIYCHTSSPTIESCKITNNLGDIAGAIYSYGGFPTVANTLIANNTSLAGSPRCGGVCGNAAGSIRLRNCTVVHNSPGGIFAASWDGMTVTNTIVWGNEMYQIQTDESWPAVTFCDVQGGWPGSGNMAAEPRFLGPSSGVGIEHEAAAGQWALASDSPCINAGTQIEDLAAADLAGGARVHSQVTDLGAYENQSDLPLLTVTPSRTADAGFVPLETSSTIELTLTNTGAEAFRIGSLSLASDGSAFTVLTPVQDRVLAPGEAIPVALGFRPVRERKYSDRLDIHSTAANAAHLQVALRGMGVAGTLVPPGPVRGVWTKASSPYIVTGDITIPRARSLDIEPGVTVRFAGHFRMTVGYRGTLRALGAEQDPIVFTAADKSEGWYGIRFVNSGSDDVLKYCTLEYARKPRTGGTMGFYDLYGGAVLCCYSDAMDPGFPIVSSPTIDSCLFIRNSARTGGALVCTDESQAVVTNNTMVDNDADLDGGGLALYYAFCKVEHNVIARNSALVGGGIMNVASCPTIVNNTFVFNRPGALYLETAQPYFGDEPPVPVWNNIIWKNDVYLSDAVQPDEYDIRYNDIQGGWSGADNLAVDPGFADLEGGDYHLQSQAGRWDPQAGRWVLDPATSPCIDAGNPASDFAREPAPNGGRINLGAYGGTDQASKSPGS